MSEPVIADAAPTGVKAKKAAIAFILITVVLDVVALGIVIPVLAPLVRSFMGGSLAEATSKASAWAGWVGALWGLMQFIFSPVFGALSDRYGRRPIVLLSNFGMAADYLLMALSPNLWWLLVGRTISGITGASISTASAYIADVTPVDKRAAAFGLIGAAFGLGFVIGPAIGGLLGQIDLRLPFFVAGGLGLCNGLYGLFVLPESNPKENRAKFSWAKANPIGSLAFLASHPGLLGLAAVVFFSQFAHYALQATFALYTGLRYHWDPKSIGLTLSGFGVMMVIVQGGLAGRAVKLLGERWALLVGLCLGAAGFAVYGLAPTAEIFLIGAPIMCLWGIAGPANQAMMSRHVKPSEQGRLQGANSAMMALAGVFGPLFYGQVFSISTAPGVDKGWWGAAFLVGSAVLGITALFATRIKFAETVHPGAAPDEETPVGWIGHEAE